MSTNTLLPFIQQCFTRYGITTYVILGNIGLILNIAVFSQSIYRRTSSSLYMLVMSICALCGLNVSSIPIIYALDNPNPLNYNFYFCQIQFYLRHAFSQSMRVFFVIICADRYAACSDKANIRALSEYKVAIRVIPSVLLFWFIVAVFPTMLRTLENGKCDSRNGINSIIYTVYLVIALGLLPLVSLLVFGVLMTKNLKQLRKRVQPTIAFESSGSVLRKRDRDMIKMLLIELTIYVITTIPTLVMNIYKSVVDYMETSKERQVIETFTYYITRTFLLYINNALSFWIYISVSPTYRVEMKKLIIKWYRSIIHKQE